MAKHEGRTLREAVSAANIADVRRERLEDWLFYSVQAYKRGKYRKAQAAATIALALGFMAENEEEPLLSDLRTPNTAVTAPEKSE